MVDKQRSISILSITAVSWKLEEGWLVVIPSHLYYLSLYLGSIAWFVGVILRVNPKVSEIKTVNG